MAIAVCTFAAGVVRRNLSAGSHLLLQLLLLLLLLRLYYYVSGSWPRLMHWNGTFSERLKQPAWWRVQSCEGNGGVYPRLWGWGSGLLVVLMEDEYGQHDVGVLGSVCSTLGCVISIISCTHASFGA
jgi:hypothetical protein